MPPPFSLAARRLTPLAVIVVSSPLLAQTWDGGGADNNWTTALNWNPNGAPLNTGGANLSFAGNIRLTPLVNIPYDVFAISFANTAGAFTIGGAANLTIRGGGITNNDAEAQTFAGPIIVLSPQTWLALNGDLQFNSPTIQLSALLTVNTGARIVNIASPIIGSGGITKEGSGTLFLGDVVASTYSGPTTINAGVLFANESNALSDASPVIVNAAGTLRLASTSDTIQSLAGSGAVDVNGGTLTLNWASNGFTLFSGVIGGNGSLTKAGTFAQTLSGANTYTGTTTVAAGSLEINLNERLANSSDLVVTGGTFNVHSFTETVDQVTMTIGTLTGAGGVLIANNFDIQSGFISARLAGAASLTKSNSSFNAFFNVAGSSYTGATNVTGGILLTNAFNVLPDTTTVNVVAPGTLQVTNFPDTIAAISGNGTVNILNTTLTVGAGNADSIIDGPIGDLGATGSLTKIGSGIITFNTPATYTGITTIEDGTVRLPGAERLANASDIVVNDGSFRIVDETIDLCTLNAGEIRPIGAIGQLHANQYLLNAGFVDASLAGPGAIIKAGPGVVTLAGANSPLFTRIDAGTLIVGSDAAFGALDSYIALNGGSLLLTNPMSLSRPLYVLAPSTLECSGDVLLTNFSPSVLASALTKTGPGTLSISGAIAGLAALNITAGAVYLAPATLHQGAAASTAAAGAFHLDNAIVTLTGTVSNLGEIRLENDARLSAAALANSGVITGSGRVTAAVTNNSAGDIRIGAKESIRFASAATLNNAGLLEVIGGTVEIDGPLTNAASTGLIFARNAALRFDGGLSNFGAVALSFGVTDVFGDVNNRAGGSIVVSGFSSATFVDDVINNGLFRTSAGAATVFLGGVSGAGSFPGTGTVFLEGDLRPGNSPAVVEFEGDLVLGSFATVQVELAGDSSFDQILVDGDAVIDGTLDVRLINDYHPTGSRVFPILVAGARAQQFSGVLLPPDTRGFVVRYTDSEVQVRFCAADFNSDGIRNSQDFFDYLTAFFASAPIADFNHDSAVNSQDFFDFLTAFFGPAC